MYNQPPVVTDAIHCENLTKTFGHVVALDNLSLAVEPGVAFALLGPNGAGKTTALRLFTGITNPTSGRISIAGEDISGRPLRLRSKIGYLPESPAFYGWMTGEEFLIFTGELYGQSRQVAKARAGELLRQVDLTEVGGRRVKTYSRGMQQRLGLGQALMNHPEVLFLDEPASALDPMGRRDMLEAIQSLKGETTIFLSSHILSDVERVCDRITIINHGSLVATGSLDELRVRQQSSVFEIEFEEDGASFVQSVTGLPWVRAIKWQERGGRRVLQLDVSDLEVAKHALPGLVFNGGLTPTRYELTTASLEDIFMDLVGAREEAT